jgi:iron complex outermembrane receptor protein
VWGANAVNGVINIITKPTQDTQGIKVTAGGGTLDSKFASARYGGHLTADTTYRVYGSTEARGASDDPNGAVANDHSHSSRAGLRLDSNLGDDRLSLQGETFNLTSGDRIGVPEITPPYSVTNDVEQHDSGGDVLARWERKLTPNQDISLQSYYDFFTLTLPTVASLQQKSIDVEFEHHIRAGTRNNITWGLDYRNVSATVNSSDIASFEDPSPGQRLSGAFLQDEVALVPDALHLTLGAKLEHETYTGTHFMPNARLLWDVTSSSEAWISASRAVRTPSEAERLATYHLNAVQPPSPFTMNLPVVPVAVVSSYGAENLTAYELGYRTELTPTLSLDAAGYLNRYTNLRASVAGAPTFAMTNGIPYLVLPATLTNNLSARTLGGEIALDWRPFDWWRLQANYSRMRITLDSTDMEGSLDSTPRQMLSLRSSMDVEHTGVDLWLRHTGARNATLQTPHIPEYWSMDASLSWHLPWSLDLAVVGQNLLAERHLEAVSTFVSSEPIDAVRSGYVRLTWTY